MLLGAGILTVCLIRVFRLARLNFPWVQQAFMATFMGRIMRERETTQVRPRTPNKHNNPNPNPNPQKKMTDRPAPV